MGGTVKRKRRYFLRAGLLVLPCMVYACTGGCYQQPSHHEESVGTVAQTASQQRDLSTPSSRLVGHWENAEGGADLYYGAVDPHLNIGTLMLRNHSGRFKILSENHSRAELVLRQYIRFDNVEGSVDVKCYIPRNGRWMTMEWAFHDGNYTSVYHYVDGNTAP
jgi:hypothetical protein